MPRDYLAEAKAELASIQERFSRAKATAERQAAAAVADFEATAAELFGRPVPFPTDEPWVQAVFRAARESVADPPPHERRQAGWDRTEAAMKILRPLAERAVNLRVNVGTGEFEGTLDGQKVGGARILTLHRRELRRWVRRWQEPLRRHANLDPRLLDADGFDADFFTWQGDNAGDDGRAGIVVIDDSNSERRAAARGMLRDEGLRERERPARSQSEGTGRTVPLGLILSNKPDELRAAAKSLTARQQELLQDYFVRHRSAEDVAIDYGSTADDVRKMAMRVADAIEAATGMRPMHRRQAAGGSDEPAG